MPKAISIVMPVATPAAKLMMRIFSKKRVRRYQRSSVVRNQAASVKNNMAARPMVNGG